MDVLKNDFLPYLKQLRQNMPIKPQSNAISPLSSTSHPMLQIFICIYEHTMNTIVNDPNESTILLSEDIIVIDFILQPQFRPFLNYLNTLPH